MNNYCPEAPELLNKTFEDDQAGTKLFRYIVWGKEVGQKGTPHLQGYLEVTKPVRISQLAKYEVFKHAHFEKRRGTRDQARDYCMKEGKVTELGNWESGGRGTRNDLVDLMEEIKKGTGKLEVMESNPICYSKHRNFVNDYRAEVEKKTTREFRDVKVKVLIGPAGCGKTRSVHEEDPGVFTVNSEDAFPFDGYDGEEAILLDDFYGGMRYSQLLKVLDGHQYRVNVKGSHRYAQWTRVYITSNKEPKEWYHEVGPVNEQGITPALARRLTSIHIFEEPIELKMPTKAAITCIETCMEPSAPRPAARSETVCTECASVLPNVDKTPRTYKFITEEDNWLICCICGAVTKFDTMSRCHDVGGNSIPPRDDEPTNQGDREKTKVFEYASGLI